MLEYITIFCVVMCLLYLIEISAQVRQLRKVEKRLKSHFKNDKDELS